MTAKAPGPFCCVETLCAKVFGARTLKRYPVATPSELVKGTRWAHDWFSRGFAAERIAGSPPTDVCDPIASGDYVLDLFDLYARMWDLAEPEAGGTRLYRPRPGSREALKWLIEDLSGTPTDPERTMPDNNRIRRAVHLRLQERGWADRINQVAFRLLRDIDARAGDGVVLGPATDASTDDGEAIVDVTIDELPSEGGVLRLGGLDWSEWRPFESAVKEAATEPGVYVARSGSEIVYVGMAGLRRGAGLRGRLQTYARGRGAVSGLGEAALDRALADPVWLADRLELLGTQGASRAKDWAAAAIAHANLHLCWTVAPDEATAKSWETDVMLELEDAALWNRARPKPLD